MESIMNSPMMPAQLAISTSDIKQRPLGWTPTELDGIYLLCSVCDLFWDLITEKNAERERLLETGLNIAEILAMDCSVHKEDFPGLVFLKLGIVQGVGLEDHPSRFSLATSPWFDMGLINFWKNQCISDHGQPCGNLWMIDQTKPAWLIDTRRKCLVPGNEGGAYICLSYQWGKRPTYQTRKAALSDLQKPGYLDQADIKARLPAVVSQSMQLVEGMNERYLWVDTLCIPQDDEDFKDTEMDRMGAIYGSALLTIVAAEGDGDHGIPGAPGAAARISNQRLLKFAHHTLIQLPAYEYMDKTRGTAYRKRGWTFQEYTMSARKLIFVDSRVHWECGCATWDEQRPMTETSEESDAAVYLTAHGLPDLYTYWSIGRDFNHRDLTHDSDALRAISGMLAVLGRGFDGGFLFGLPVMFFDLALWWKPLLSDTELRRRSTPSQQLESMTAHLPSWSWVGWQGQVSCCGDEIGFEVNASKLSQTHSITTWYAGHEPHGLQRRPIASWFHRRPLHCNPYPPPPGWTSEELAPAPSQRNTKPPGCGRHVFRHDSVPHKTFWYHLPTHDTGSNNSTAIPSQMPYLFGRTTRVHMHVSERFPENLPVQDDVTTSPKLYLRDDCGNHVGHTWLHTESDFSLIPVDDGVGFRIELAAICRRTLIGDDPLWEGVGDPVKTAANGEERDEYAAYWSKNELVYRDYYAVLWIEWNNGIAYRQASGVVERSAWDNHPGLEEFDLVLG
ncbi:hypothetical protein PG985_013537 [Apiospora marii]|uniref:uncharacterized protein n=1 Tax=Apiospora marii TaxID=335849 RepID=UPI00312F7B7D